MKLKNFIKMHHNLIISIIDIIQILNIFVNSIVISIIIIVIRNLMRKINDV